MFGLTHQPIKPEFKNMFNDELNLGDIKVGWFDRFEKNKHITWQQYVLGLAVERAIRGVGSPRIAVSAGRGVGKSSFMAMLLIWYLFCHKNAQVACTAPTHQQMHDVLWKEVKLWLDKLPPKIAAYFDWSSSYIRIVEKPETWWARAMTARKEAPDSLAGLHGEYVMAIVDESSGVDDSVFQIGEGMFTGKNVLFIMISNYRRTTGYFHEAFNENKKFFQTLSFDSSESPIVEPTFLATMLNKGKDSDEYRVEVAGLPPRVGDVDDSGYVSLINPDEVKFNYIEEFIGPKFMGVDPAGEGRNETLWVIRDFHKARIVAREKTSSEKSVAAKTVNLMTQYGVKPEHVAIDCLGVGEKTVTELFKNRIYVVPVNVVDKPDDEKYFNKRSEMYWRMREWLKSGGELFGDKDLWKDIFLIRYTTSETNSFGKIRVMSKQKMRKQKILGASKSTDTADALNLTFHFSYIDEEPNRIEPDEPFDRFAAI
jgi:hypothetical protein